MLLPRRPQKTTSRNPRDTCYERRRNKDGAGACAALSRGQLTRVFRASYGCSIAVRASYTDQSHMGRDFKRILGMMPGALRQPVA